MDYSAPRPSCPHCDEPIGVYEPVWWIGPLIEPSRTSLLARGRPPEPSESLWHAICAEAEGIDGG
jgi:hypothetical protein